MFRLALVLFSMIATSTAGIAVVAVLTMGYASVASIGIAAAIGALIGVPVTYFVAQKIANLS